MRDKAVDPRPDINVKRWRSAIDETGSPKILVEVVGSGTPACSAHSVRTGIQSPGRTANGESGG